MNWAVWAITECVCRDGGGYLSPSLHKSRGSQQQSKYSPRHPDHHGSNSFLVVREGERRREKERERERETETVGKIMLVLKSCCATVQSNISWCLFSNLHLFSLSKIKKTHFCYGENRGKGNPSMTVEQIRRKALPLKAQKQARWVLTGWMGFYTIPVLYRTMCDVEESFQK